MQILKTRDELQGLLAQARRDGKNIGLVPTMGNLHRGHLALVDAAIKECDFVLATIFANPLQFGPEEDFENYPKTPESDYAKLEQSGCNVVFEPSVSELYPGGLDHQTQVTVPGLSERHCGVSRPVHFGGVCTVVSKLFNLTMPDTSFFGQKDYQQLQIIRKMTADLCMPIKIVGVPTVRENNGLAMSSRNNYLDESQLLIASNIYTSLEQAKIKIEKGERDYPALEAQAIEFLTQSGLKTDYFSVCNAATLEPATQTDLHLVILTAAWLSPTRLIDNIQVKIIN
jgi:pantoate--beta-alanine ligase